MSAPPIYRFRKTRRQQAWQLVLGAFVLWGFIGSGLWYESLTGDSLPPEFRFWSALGLGVAGAISLVAALWCLRHPAEYLAEVTHERLLVQHPGSRDWCIDVPVAEIKRFEYRRTHSPGGEGILQHGVLLHNGEFHHINMNYGVSLKRLYKAAKQVNANVTFPSKVNKRMFGGPIEREYED